VTVGHKKYVRYGKLKVCSRSTSARHTWSPYRFTTIGSGVRSRSIFPIFDVSIIAHKSISSYIDIPSEEYRRGLPLDRFVTFSISVDAPSEFVLKVDQKSQDLEYFRPQRTTASTWEGRLPTPVAASGSCRKFQNTSKPIGNSYRRSRWTGNRWRHSTGSGLFRFFDVGRSSKRVTRLSTSQKT